MSLYLPWYSSPIVVLGGGLLIAALVGLYAYSRVTSQNIGQSVGQGIVAAGSVAVDVVKETAKELYKEVDIGGGEEFASVKWGENAAAWAKNTGGPVQKLLGTEGSAAKTFPDLVSSLFESNYTPKEGQKCKKGFHDVLGVCWIDEFGSTAGKVKTPEVRARLHEEYLENLKKGIDTNKVTVAPVIHNTAEKREEEKQKLTRAQYVDGEVRKWMASHPGSEFTLRPEAPKPPGGWQAFHKAKGEEYDKASGALTSLASIGNRLARRPGDPTLGNRHK